MSKATMKLFNQSRGYALAENLRVAQSFWERSKGLLGEKSLPSGQALWIQGSPLIDCNSIHTFFMRFAIDAVFVDRDLRVKSTYQELRPWRMTWPTAGAASVFELPAGTLKNVKIEIGDILHVGH